MADKAPPPLSHQSRDIQGSQETRDISLWHPSLIARSSTGARGGHEVKNDNKANVKTLDEDPDGLLDDDGHPKRTGNVFTAASNIITAVIGAGVLSLAWCTAQVGWVAGPLMQIIFASITIYCSLLLADVYRYPGPYEGKRNYTYSQAVRAFLGPKYVAFCAITQYLNLVATGVGYTVTAGLGMVAMYRAHCYHYHPIAKEGDNLESGDAGCRPAINKYMIIFGVIQIVFSQIPNLEEIWWLSVLAAVMSFLYATIGLGLSSGKATEPQSVHSHGTLRGVPIGGPDGEGGYMKTWNFLLALGNVAFAYSYSYIMIEVADTVKAPREADTIKKATWVSLVVTSFYYMGIGTIGYAAFGDAAPGNLLTGFGFFEPYWLIIIANLAIVIHLIGAYQVWTQPWLMFVESTLEGWFPNSYILKAGFNLPVGKGKSWRLKYYILVWRTSYVIFTTIVACLAPFFNDIVGLMGSIGFWPLVVFLPICMKIAQDKIPRWSLKWTLMHALSVFCLIITIAGIVGSIAGIYIDTRNYKAFAGKY